MALEFTNYDLMSNKKTEGASLTGGRSIDWVLRLNELRRRKRWSAIVALGEVFLERRLLFKDLLKIRQDDENQERFNRLRAEIDAWNNIHYRLGTAYAALQRMHEAEEAHWAALGLSFGLCLLPPMIHPTQFGRNLWRLQDILESQGKLRSHQILWSFFQGYIDEEVARRKQWSETNAKVVETMTAEADD